MRKMKDKKRVSVGESVVCIDVPRVSMKIGCKCAAEKNV